MVVLAYTTTWAAYKFQSHERVGSIEYPEPTTKYRPKGARK